MIPVQIEAEWAYPVTAKEVYPVTRFGSIHREYFHWKLLGKDLYENLKGKVWEKSRSDWMGWPPDLVRYLLPPFVWLTKYIKDIFLKTSLKDERRNRKWIWAQSGWNCFYKDWEQSADISPNFSSGNMIPPPHDAGSPAAVVGAA